MCCSVLQRVAVCCSVLQCVAVCCSALQCVAVRCSVLQCVDALHVGVKMIGCGGGGEIDVLGCEILECVYECTHDVFWAIYVYVRWCDADMCLYIYIYIYIHIYIHMLYTLYTYIYTYMSAYS